MTTTRLASVASVLVGLAACSNVGSGRADGREGGAADGRGGGAGADAGSGAARGWSTSVHLGPARNTAQIEIHGVDVAVDEAGTALVAWEEDADTAGSAWIAWYRANA